ncbi:hypothetical protein A2634_04935 [Candidatus Amesbacteria bacterium RIFCSPHIGHO2_01_FULL_48_32]|uniref:Glycosyltransferase RgtA/B/C/D-like domain-containing protein n=1 Tax=Candidatus Amesbacteria bacterium RIFCSPLOWO2_01_FULL_48_25 TaxID=1797259 RepID=A0A1F4ZCH5_9BACT|nr:MAG: hypothetical protein A2634_04935 [Candidatus Amesbacteria bacterium RIFCSPHIGHO2_01_FULL_48_32]OGD04013.1 MAG: hypothetical protein A2989_01285 [Candidatus Amesbacteria bacterium RIFCSPLOWO2_01_FULL_48_25]
MFARFSFAAFSPPSVNWDEAAFGYNAYSLLLTGKDEYGYKLPLAFRSFDEYKPPLYVYLSVPFIKFMGLNDISVRMVSRVSGIFGVILIMVVATLITRNWMVGLIGGFLAAVEPWVLMFSRMGVEATLSLTLFLICLAWLIKAEKQSRYYYWALVTAGINTLAYHSAKVYFGIIAVYVLTRVGRDTKKLIRTGAVILLAGGPMIWGLFTGSTLARFNYTSILTLAKDRPMFVFVGEVVNRYFSYFNPTNLFVRGSNETGQKLEGFAPYMKIEFVFWIVGLCIVISDKKLSLLKKWLLVGAIPAMITWSWFSLVRILPLLAAFTIVIAIGMTKLLKKRVLGVLFVGFLVINTVWVLSSVWFTTPYFQYGDWQWGFREVVEVIKPIEKDYDWIVWESPHAQPHILTLFYWNYPPNQYHKDIVSPESIPSPRLSFDFGKFRFRKIYWPEDRGLKKVLFVGGVYSLPESDLARDQVKIIKDIIDPQGYVSFRIAGT